MICGYYIIIVRNIHIKKGLLTDSFFVGFFYCLVPYRGIKQLCHPHVVQRVSAVCPMSSLGVHHDLGGPYPLNQSEPSLCSLRGLGST